MALDHAGVDERGKDLVGALRERSLLLRRLGGVLYELVRARPGVPALLDLGEHYGVRDAQSRTELLGLCRNEALEGLLVPAHKVRGWRLHLDLAGALGVSTCLGQRLCALDVVLGGLCDHAALGIEAGAAGAPCNLVELARVESAHVPAIELGELGEKHGVDGDVDAHAQRVGTADYGQQALLRELLHQQAVARQHTGVVHAHARAGCSRFRVLPNVVVKRTPLTASFRASRLLLRRDAVAREGLRALEGQPSCEKCTM